MDPRVEKIMAAADYIAAKLEGKRPFAGIVLGSGLGKLADKIENQIVIPYREIPGFPVSTAVGHKGNFIAGDLGGKFVVAMQGRFHYYEGFTARELCYPLYVMKLLGIENLIVTNACGGVNRDFKPGDLMIIDNYINFIRVNPLIGDNDDRFGPRFPDMSEPYSPVLLEKAEKAAEKLGIDYKRGVYALFNGPCYESAAEIRAFAALGADAVGMSTVPETICGNYLGMKVFGVSCITNMAAGVLDQPLTEEEVLETGAKSGAAFQALMTRIVEKL